jgi:prevent-host-death family protein
VKLRPLISMGNYVTASEANRHFAKLLRKVREGRSFVVTSNGEPVARLVPIGADREDRERTKKKLLARLDKQPVPNLARWTRDELYDR